MRHGRRLHGDQGQGAKGVGGAEVWRSYREGGLAQIRNYCEADCVNTYLLFLRFQQMRCVLTAAQYADECTQLRAVLEKTLLYHSVQGVPAAR